MSPRRPAVHGAVASALAALLILFAAPSAAQVVFTPLGDLPGGAFESKAWDLSADGRVVVGHSRIGEASEGFRWEDGVMESLGTLPGAGGSVALAISEDGSVIAGRSGSHAARWEDGVISALPDAPGFTEGTAYGANADGSVLVGDSGSGTRWIDGVVESLPDMGSASGVSDDGSVIGGLGLHGAYTHGILWRDGTVLVLGIAAGGSYSSVTDVSGDGTVAVGYDGVGPYAWTEAEGMVSLGSLPDGSDGRIPWAVSGDGRIVVGGGQTELGDEAFVWSAPTGVRRLKDAIESDFGLDLGDWTLAVAAEVSPDGRFVVGWGTNPDGYTEGWLLEVPDADGDGWPDLADNCLGLANPDQADADGDGAGDACEPACGDGLDNDGDGAVDLADVGCSDENGATESPACSDGLNNDPGEDALVDFDGGAAAGLPPELQTVPDPQCIHPWKDREASRPKCGLGFELAPLLAALRLRWPRTRSRRGGASGTISAVLSSSSSHITRSSSLARLAPRQKYSP